MTEVLVNRSVNLVLQGKGGVGKSLAALCLCDYFQAREIDLLAIDTDPVNATLTGFKGVAAHPVELMDEGSNEINPRAFDRIIGAVLEAPGAVVVDNGASSFIPLTNYMLENHAIGVLADAGREVVVHVVVAGGGMIAETLSGLKQLLETLPKEAKIVVWLNEFWGPVAIDGEDFETLGIYKNNRARISGIVRLVQRTRETFGRDIQDMVRRRQTFGEALASAEIAVMERSRLARVRGEIHDSLATILS